MIWNNGQNRRTDREHKQTRQTGTKPRNRKTETREKKGKLLSTERRKDGIRYVRRNLITPSRPRNRHLQ